MNKNFLSRIEFVLDGRAPFPWANRIGIGRGVMSRIRQGVIPAAEALARIALTENVSITWLLTGVGSPYIVSALDSDSEIASLLSTHLEDEASWRIYWCTDHHRSAFVLTQPAQLEDKAGDLIDYITLEIIAGPMGKETHDTLATAVENGRDVNVVEFTAADMKDLIEGRLGSFQLISQEKGLLAGRHRGNKIAEFLSRYEVGKRTLTDMLSELDPPQRKLVEDAVRGMLQGANSG